MDNRRVVGFARSSVLGGTLQGPEEYTWDAVRIIKSSPSLECLGVLAPQGRKGPEEHPAGQEHKSGGEGDKGDQHPERDLKQRTNPVTAPQSQHHRTQHSHSTSHSHSHSTVTAKRCEPLA